MKKKKIHGHPPTLSPRSLHAHYFILGRPVTSLPKPLLQKNLFATQHLATEPATWLAGGTHIKTTHFSKGPSNRSKLLLPNAEPDNKISYSLK